MHGISIRSLSSSAMASSIKLLTHASRPLPVLGSCKQKLCGGRRTASTQQHPCHRPSGITLYLVYAHSCCLLCAVPCSRAWLSRRSNTPASPHGEAGWAAWQQRRRHFFVLTAAGKPVYSRHGDEQALAGGWVDDVCGAVFQHQTGDWLEMMLRQPKAVPAYGCA